MIPLLIMGGVAAGSALVQWYNSKQAQEASAEERAKVKAMIDNIQSPNFDPKQFTPDQYKVVAKYIPKVSAFVQEVAPQLTKADSVGAVQGREAQMNALNRLRNLSATGTDEQSQLMQQEATNSVNAANRGRQGAIQEDFARRGAGGGGMELLAQLSNAQAANDTQANMSRQNAMAAYQTKLQALKDSASIGGQVRDADVSLESRNNDVLNDFNRRTAVNVNSYNQNTDAIQNDANKFNTVNEQDVANRNTTAGNDASKYNMNRDDANKQTSFQDTMGKVNAYAGQAAGARQDIKDNTRDNNSVVAGAADGIQTGLAYAYSQPKTPDTSTGQTNVTADNTQYNPLNRKYGKMNS